MAKKFFYNKVYNLGKIVLNITFFIALIASIIIIFSIVTNHKLSDPREYYGIKNNLTVQVGTEIENRMFFDYNKIEFADSAKIVYPNNFDRNISGKYEVTIIIDNQTFITNLIIENI